MVLLRPAAIALPLLGLFLAGCNRQSVTAYDPDLLAEIRQVKAFDNHAHPVLAPAAGQKADRDFDALPVDKPALAFGPIARALSQLPIQPLQHAAHFARAAQAVLGSSGPGGTCTSGNTE